MSEAGPGVGQLRIERPAPGSPRKRRRRWPWIAAAVLALVVAAALFIPRTATVETVSVVSTTPSQQYVVLTASGYVVAQRRAAVASKATGRLVELRVREGSSVKKGEVIARLDASDVQASVLAAQAGVRQAEAGVRQAQAVSRQAEVEQRNAAADLQRTLGLEAQGFVSPQAVDAARKRLAAARAAFAATQASVAQAQATHAQARAQLKVQQVNEDYTLIRAPFDGVVLVKNANVGDVITPFSSAAGTQGAVVTLADMTTLEVEADVSESNIAKVRIGQPVEIVLDALPDTRLAGTVAGIVPTVDRAKATVMTKIRFDAPDPRVLPEMSAKASFLSQRPGPGEMKPVLAVAPDALVDRNGSAIVLRIGSDSKLEAVPVKPGRKIGDVVEVSGALKSGDKVVVRPDARLESGSRVEVAAK